jgi:hypothetical protein
MTFIDYLGALEEVDEKPSWHFASASDWSVFFNNVKTGKGIIHSVSYMIQLDPNLSSATTPYDIVNGNTDKEVTYERVRSERFAHLPSRKKSLFVFPDKETAEQANKVWFPGEGRIAYEAWIMRHSNTHIGDSRWLNEEDWGVAAEKYWAGVMTDSPLVEVVVHGTLYFPNWEKIVAPDKPI